MEKKVLEFTTHNEFLFKERQQSKVKISKLERRNNQLDVNMKQRESAKLKIKQKLEEIAERLGVTEEKNLELHNVISKINH